MFVFALTALTSARLSPAPAGHARYFHVRVPAQLDHNIESFPTTTPSTIHSESTLISSSSSNYSTSSTSVGSASSATSSSIAPSQTFDASVLADINTIHARRLPFIVANVNSPSKISYWCVCPDHWVSSAITIFFFIRISTLGSNGQWPNPEIDYTTGCDAQRANWPAQDHWKRLGSRLSELIEF